MFRHFSFLPFSFLIFHEDKLSVCVGGNYLTLFADGIAFFKVRIK
jgi:hypothetical protein